MVVLSPVSGSFQACLRAERNVRRRYEGAILIWGVVRGYHFIYDSNGLAHGGRLKAHVSHAHEEIVCSDRALELVEVELLDLLRVGGHVLGLDQDSILGARGSRLVSHDDGMVPCAQCCQLFWLLVCVQSAASRSILEI